MTECPLCVRFRIPSDIISLHDDSNGCVCCRGCRERLRPFTLGVLETCPFCLHRTNVRGFAGRTDNYVLPHADVIREHHAPTIVNSISKMDINYFNYALSQNQYNWLPGIVQYDDVDFFLYTEDFACINKFWLDPTIRAKLVQMGLHVPNVQALEKVYDLREFMNENRANYPILHLQDPYMHGVMTAYLVNTNEKPRAYFERVFPLIHYVQVPLVGRLLNYDENLQIQNLVNNNDDENNIIQQEELIIPLEQDTINIIVEEQIEPVVNVDVVNEQIVDAQIDLAPLNNARIRQGEDPVDLENQINNVPEEQNNALPYPRRRYGLIVFDTLIWIFLLIIYLIKMIFTLFLLKPLTTLCQVCSREYSNYQHISQKYKVDNGYVYDIPDGDLAVDANRPIVFGNNKTIRYKLWWIIPTFIRIFFHYLKIRVYYYITKILCNCRHDVINHDIDMFSGLNAMDPYLTSYQVLNPHGILGTFSNVYTTLGYTHYYIGEINVDCYEHIIQTRIAQINSSNVANTIAANVSQYFMNNKIDISDEIRVNTSMYCLQRIRLMQYRMNNIPNLVGGSFPTVPF